MTEPSLNQFAPPRAEVADHWVSDEVPVMKLFSAQGRIGRLRLLAYYTAATFLAYALMGLGDVLMSEGPAAVITLLVLLPYLWFTALCAIKRCHDRGYSGWAAITFFIPIVGLYWLIAAGDKQSNRFGPPPPPNGRGVGLLALLFPVIFVLGILAAIAIPAYQGYVTKARAAQSAPAQR